jgi:hypothetical protein
MELKNFFAQDLQGNVIPSPTVYLYLPGGTTLATGLEDQDGNAIDNPFTGSSKGQVTVAAPDGDYDIRVVGAGRDTTMRVRFIDSVSGAETLRNEIEPVLAEIAYSNQRSSPFGRSGMRVAVGEMRDSHYGWGGVVAFPSGKWVHVYRKASTHGIKDNAELRARDSYDGGANWVNDRLVYQNATHDARPDAPRLMANNRMGFFVNRQDEGSTHFSPLFFKSDDEGDTFSSAEVTTSSPYTFQAANGGILDFPASQGGHDTLGFISYGYLSAVGLDAFTTNNNGDTWSTVTEVAAPDGVLISAISENVGVRVGTQDKWIFIARNTMVDGSKRMAVWTTTNMLNWGTPHDAGVDLNANPPGALYDSATNKFHLLSFARGNRAIAEFENHLLHIEADADALYNANGSFSALGLSYSMLTPVPSWATGYIAPFRHNGKWFATFTCGETGIAGGNLALQVLIGDFAATGADTMKLVWALMRHQKDVHLLEVVADDNELATAPLLLKNKSKTASVSLGAYGLSALTGGATYTVTVNNAVVFDFASTLLVKTTDTIYGLADKIPGVSSSALHLGVQGSTYPASASYSGSSSSRKHHVFHNLNGEVGSISTSGTATAFTTSSDESWKEFIGNYDPLAAIAIIKADPVREFNWKQDRGGGYAIGWGAQTSYAVSQDLATPGGWFKDDIECAPDTEGAVYVPWGVDQAKRTPYLWAAMSYLVDKLAEAEARIASIETKL